MNKTDILNKVTGAVGKTKFTLQKHSPEILLVAGVVGTVTSAVLACRATLKVEGILEESKQKLDTIHECTENEEITTDIYSEEDAQKDTTIVYVQTGVNLAKLYAPSVILGGLSIASIFASHNIMRKRNMSLAAAYAAIDKGWKEYRKRVVEKFGEDADHELRYNIKAQKIEEMITDEETGKTKKVKSTVETTSLETSDYAKFFDETCRGWEQNPEYTMLFLRAQQNYANDMLKAQGHLFLNEVYDMLDIPRTKAGNIVGWIYDPGNPNIDNYVDFGIFQTKRANQRFVNGLEDVVLLDFNVDGNIIDSFTETI